MLPAHTSALIERRARTAADANQLHWPPLTGAACGRRVRPGSRFHRLLPACWSAGSPRRLLRAQPSPTLILASCRRCVVACACMHAAAAAAACMLRRRSQPAAHPRAGRCCGCCQPASSKSLPLEHRGQFRRWLNGVPDGRSSVRLASSCGWPVEEDGSHALTAHPARDKRPATSDCVGLARSKL